MERLTFNGNFCDIAMCAEMPCKYPDGGCSQRQVWERLKAFEDAEEQGRLVVLPCKVGDAVWFADKTFDSKQKRFISFVHSGYVKAIKFSAKPTKMTVEYEDLEERNGRCKGADYFVSNIGKTVFLTPEAAEAKLREMEGHDGTD